VRDRAKGVRSSWEALATNYRPDVYIPLARAQAIGKAGPAGSLKNDVNTVYVTAASAASIPSLQAAIMRT